MWTRTGPQAFLHPIDPGPLSEHGRRRVWGIGPGACRGLLPCLKRHCLGVGRRHPACSLAGQRRAARSASWAGSEPTPHSLRKPLSSPDSPSPLPPPNLVRHRLPSPACPDYPTHSLLPLSLPCLDTHPNSRSPFPTSSKPLSAIPHPHHFQFLCFSRPAPTESPSSPLPLSRGNSRVWGLWLMPRQAPLAGQT